jgi:thioredoxin-related protein
MLSILTSCDGQINTGENTPAANSIESDKSVDAIQWLSFEDAVNKAELVPKKIFIDVYTSWCGWCKKMDATTFKEAEVVKYINENYYAVKLNAETKDTIRFRDKEFKFIAEYKANELTISLLNGKMGYPSYVLLDEKYTMMTPPVQSYLTKEKLMPILVYFGDEIFKTKSWEEYEAENP